MCPTITIGQPASIAFLNGTYSHDASSCAVSWVTAAPVCESSLVSPCPGKCLAQGSTPASSIALTWAATISPTSWGSLPKERGPITGLLGLVSTSATGAKSTLKPMSARYPAMAAPTSAARGVARGAHLAHIGHAPHVEQPGIGDAGNKIAAFLVHR